MWRGLIVIEKFAVDVITLFLLLSAMICPCMTVTSLCQDMMVEACTGLGVFLNLVRIRVFHLQHRPKVPKRVFHRPTIYFVPLPVISVNDFISKH